MKISKRDEFYYWVKIRQDLMYSKEMKLLMRQPDGSLYFSIYIYLIMLTINSKGRLAQQVGELEVVYDLPMITQELMFFKIDTIRVAIGMLKQIGLLYTDEENVTCVSGFDNIVGSSTGWSDIKRKQREKGKLIESVDNVHTNVHAEVHEDVHEDVHVSDHIEYREKSKEYRVKNKEKDSYDLNDLNDENDYNDKITLASELKSDFDLNNFKINEWHIELSNSHIFTRYLVHSNFIEEGNLETLYDANAFFDSYLRTMYSFEEMKIQVQYFLFQYRKLPKEEKMKITNKLAYMTNAIKKNKRTKDWLSSDEFNSIQKIEETVENNLRNEALELFPDDEVKQEVYINEYFLMEFGQERRRLYEEWEGKRPLKS